MVRLTTWAWGWAIASASGCAPEPSRHHEIPPVTWAGEHLEYAPQEGAPEPCAGTLPYMDRFVELVAEEMGVALERSLVFVHGEDARAVCDDDGVYGCGFRDGAVFARGVPMEHELVHGVRSQHGFSSYFFEEGTAEAFGDDMLIPNRLSSFGNLVEGMVAGSGKKLPTKWYPRAGHFSAWLHEHYGPEVTTALLLRTDRDSTGGMAVTVLEQTTGLTFAEILEDYAAEPTCPQWQYRYPLVPCAAPVDLRVTCEATAELADVRVACDDPSTLGPRRHDPIFRYLTLEVEQDGLYTVTAFDQRHRLVPFTLKECALGCDSTLVGFFDVDDVRPVFLRAGRYALELSPFTDDPVDAQVRVEGLGCS